MLADQPFLALLSALAIGLLIGIERGWARRDLDEGARVAGVRTYALLGLLGGIVGLVSLELGALVVAVGVIAVTIVLVTAYAVDAGDESDAGITSEVAALATFVFALVAGRGQAEIAGAGAVLMALLLGFKPELHGWLTRIHREELKAFLTLLLLSVVLLPILPDRGYGPWNALNPREIWWMVVLIAALSFGGYIAIRTMGASRGVLATGVLGGIASSTALTLHFARVAGRGKGPVGTLAAGIHWANVAMFIRMALILAVVNPSLLLGAATPLAAMAAASALAGALLVARGGRDGGGRPESLWNPLELAPALGFGAFLALVMLLAAAVDAWLGGRGVLGLAAISGAIEVNAITITLARPAGLDVMPAVAVHGIVIAAIANTLFKGVAAIALGGWNFLGSALLPLLLTAAVGVIWLAVF